MTGELKTITYFKEKNLEFCHFVINNQADKTNGELLFVYPRAEKHADGSVQKNAKIFRAGKLTHSWCMGNGIADIQIDAAGQIWTSYYDEGVFGNFGWEMGETLGGSGLVCWDMDGTKITDFFQIATPETFRISDCAPFDESPNAIRN